MKLRFDWKFYDGVADEAEKDHYILDVDDDSVETVGQCFKDNLGEFHRILTGEPLFSFGHLWANTHPEYLHLPPLLLAQIGDIEEGEGLTGIYGDKDASEKEFTLEAMIEMLSELTNQELYDIFIDDTSSLFSDNSVSYKGTIQKIPPGVDGSKLEPPKSEENSEENSEESDLDADL